MYSRLSSSWRAVAAAQRLTTRTAHTRPLSSRTPSAARHNNHHANGGSVRHLFGSLPEQEYKSLEYPTAKEPPEITKTIASQVRGQAPKTTKHFDEQAAGPALSADFVQAMRSKPLM